MARRKGPAIKKRKAPEDDHPFGSESEPEAPAPAEDNDNQPLTDSPAPPSKTSDVSDSIKLRLRTNTNAHPANAAGLYKHTQADISARIAARTAQKDARTRKQKEHMKEIERLEAAGIYGLAELEDERAEEERSELLDDAGSEPDDEISDYNSEPEDDSCVDDQDAMDIDENVPAKRGGSSRRQQRKKKFAELRDAVATQRQISASAARGTGLTKTKEPVKARPAKRAKIMTDQSNYDPAWQKAIKDRANRQKLMKAVNALSLSDSTPAAKKKTGVGAAVHERAEEAELGTAFTDADVVTLKPSLGQMSTGRRAQLAAIVSDSPHRSKDSNRTSVPPGGYNTKPSFTLSMGQLDPKAPVRMKGKVIAPATDSSRSKDVLPPWIQGAFKTELLPTLVDFFGARENPWELSGTDGTLFSSVLQRMVDEFYPDEHYVPARSGADKVYTLARQHISDHRRKFQMTALTLIQKAVKPHQQKGTAAVVKYVNEALDPSSGVAYWANPEGANGPEGAFQSVFIVKTLAEHVKAMEGSQLEVSCFPVGAFILAITAVSRAFLMFSTGAFINAGSFSKENIGNLTTEWSDGAAVKTFLAKKHRMDELLDRVDDFLNKKPTLQQTRTATQNQYHTLSKAAATIVDRSSPPAPEIDE